jgi:hypothetical protein
VTVDNLDEPVVEGVLDVKLASLPFKGEHRTECLVEVLLLGETMKHLACFVAIEGSIGLQLVVKDPLVGDDVRVPRRRNKVPSVIAEESVEIRDHSIEPIGILEHNTCGRRNQRVHVEKSMQVKPFTGRDTYVGGAACAMHMCGRRGWRVLARAMGRAPEPGSNNRN